MKSMCFKIGSNDTKKVHQSSDLTSGMNMIVHLVLEPYFLRTLDIFQKILSSSKTSHLTNQTKTKQDRMTRMYSKRNLRTMKSTCTEQNLPDKR